MHMPTAVAKTERRNITTKIHVISERLKRLNANNRAITGNYPPP